MKAIAAHHRNSQHCETSVTAIRISVVFVAASGRSGLPRHWSEMTELDLRIAISSQLYHAWASQQTHAVTVINVHGSIGFHGMHTI